jgi:mRNA guanylyltransferase
MLKDHPHMAAGSPFEYVAFLTSGTKMINSIPSIKVKPIRFSYHIKEVFSVDIPALQHGHDGLIYTCVNTPYTPGTDNNMRVFIVKAIVTHADHFGVLQFEVETAI